MDGQIKDQVEKLKNAPHKEKVAMSKSFGLKSGSVFNELLDFSVTGDMLYDPIHILLEGLVTKESQLLLNYINKKTTLPKKYPITKTVKFPLFQINSFF